MNLNQYVPLAIRTEAPTQLFLDNVTYDGSGQGLNTRMPKDSVIRLLHGAIGVAGEAGEISEAYDRWKIDPKKRKLDIENIGEEIGDGFWYCALIRDTYPKVFNDAGLAGLAVMGRKKPKIGGLIRRLEIETAKILDLAKRAAFYGKTPSDQDVFEHVLTVEGVFTALAFALHLDTDKIRAANIAKLKARFPDKFDQDKAIDRNLPAEKTALEEGGK